MWSGVVVGCRSSSLIYIYIYNCQSKEKKEKKRLTCGPGDVVDVTFLRHRMVLSCGVVLGSRRHSGRLVVRPVFGRREVKARSQPETDSKSRSGTMTDAKSKLW